MPTPSELILREQRGEWAARTDTPKRSVFGNYRASVAPESPLEQPEATPPPLGPQEDEAKKTQFAIDTAMARSFIHRFLALAYADPQPETFAWLNDAGTMATVRSTAEIVPESPRQQADRFLEVLNPGAFDSFRDAYLAAFGHAARGSCPLNEIEYGDIKADPLFQPHRLADLAAFYRAFGLEVAGDAGERQDHLCLELEFMCVLAAKEAYALKHQLDTDHLEQCRAAQRKFLREHLGRWTPAFTRRLAAATSDPVLSALAEFTRAFVEAECRAFAVNAGSQDLLLRPVDEAEDRMCDACGISNLPPGAEAKS